MKKIGFLLLLTLALFAASGSTPNGWKWDKSSIARADDGAPANPNGWSWNALPAGWSWNEAEIVSTGSKVTLASDDSSVAVAAPAGAETTVGATIAVIDTGDDTLLGFRTDQDGMVWTALGWSWND